MNLIYLFTSFFKAKILFVLKLNKKICLCINNQSLNNLIIKNNYSLFLISQLLNNLSSNK